MKRIRTSVAALVLALALAACAQTGGSGARESAAGPVDAPLWSIAWITDTQTPECEWITPLLDRLKADKPSLILHTGDTRFEWANRCAWKDVLDLMRSADPPLEMHLSVGNHDDAARYTLQERLSRAAVLGVYPWDTGEIDPASGKKKEHVVRDMSGPGWPAWNPEVAANPNWRPGHPPPYRYVFNRGGIRFVVCDCYWSPEQQEWVRGLIAQPNDSSATIILQHEHFVDKNVGYVNGLEGRHNVKLMLTGHDHTYHFEERAGVAFVTGQGMNWGHYKDSDAFTLWVYRDHLRLDRYVEPAGEPRKPVTGPTTVWTCKGDFTPYVRPPFPPAGGRSQ